MIRNYTDFIRELQTAGFSGAVNGNEDGVFGLFRYGWGAESEDALYWHTGDPDTDPWEWRVRVLEERDDIAYGKVFFRKAGYITKEWYPYFLAARRGGLSFNETYRDGVISHAAKRIYDTLRDSGSLPVHDIKTLGGFGRADKSRFDRALTDLQMGLFITMCGRRQKLTRMGEEYGWASMMYCTAEEFWPDEVSKQADGFARDEAAAVIRDRLCRLSTDADGKKVERFIFG